MQSVHTVPGAWDVIKNIGIDAVLTAVYGPSSPRNERGSAKNYPNVELFCL